MLTADHDKTEGAEATSDRAYGALGALWRALRANRTVAALVVLATLVGCLAWLTFRTPTYRAHAQVVVNPRPPDDRTFLGLSVIKDTGDPTRTIQTAAALLDSPDAARLAGRRLDPPQSEEDVLAAVDIVPQGESNILDVVATASSPGDAAALADAYVDAALEQRNATLRGQAQPVIDRLTGELAAVPPADGASAAEIAARLTQLREVLSEGDPTVELARRATPPAGAEGAPASLVVLLALVAGTVLAAVVALLIELLAPPRVATDAELSDVTRMPVLARVPRPGWSWRRQSRSPPPLTRSALDAFRMLRLRLELTLDSEPCVVMLTSPSRGDGTTTSVVQFAQSLAAGGRRVLIADLDFGRPGLAQLLGVWPEQDLVTLRDQRRPWREGVVDVSGAPGVALLVASWLPDVSGDELAGPLAHVFREAADEFDYVLVATPPLAEVGDALKLSAAADALLLVARLGSTTLADLETAGELLDRTGRYSAGLIALA
jgi:Mrp family chromosome partitioning ATPase